MNKSTLLAAAVVATLVSAPSFASYISTFNVSGSATVTGFADGDSKTFSIDLFDMTGAMQIKKPFGNWIESVSVSGDMVTDFNQNGVVVPPVIAPPYVISIPSASPLVFFGGYAAMSGLSLPVYNFGFTPGAPGVHDGAGVALDFGIEYDGAMPPSTLMFLNTLLGTSFIDPTGAGRLDVTGTVYSDGITMNVIESGLNWAGFGSLLAAADNLYGPSTPNSITTDFALRNVQVKVVPEPATLGLLGLGLLGLAAARRRRVA